MGDDESKDRWDSIKTRLRDTNGEVVEGGIDVRFGGACPVQGYGTIDGRACYYRSRSGDMRLDIFPTAITPEAAWDILPDPEWSHGEDSTAEHYGWEDAATSAAFIKRAAAAWRKERP